MHLRVAADNPNSAAEIMFTKKNEIRRQMKERLRHCSVQERVTAGQVIARHVMSFLLSNWPNHKVLRLGLFHSLRDEVNTQPLISECKELGVNVYTPTCEGSSLIFSALDLAASHSVSLITAYYFDVLIVPGLAFDTKGGRLGRGKSYYDRFLYQHPQPLVIGIGFDFQVVPQLPIEDHDVRIDFICTPSHFLKAIASS